MDKNSNQVFQVQTCLLTCPLIHPTHSTLMKDSQIIHDYLITLAERAEQVGDDKLAYAVGNIYELIKSFKLGAYELETMEYKTIRMKEDIKETNKNLNVP